MTEGKRVMIVEDSNTVRYEVKLILGKIGITLVEVANGLGMFNLLEEYGKKVDMVIMDLTLKRENGFDLIKKLQAMESMKNVPIMVLTEHADKANVLKARELGVAGYLRKPIKKDELINRVSRILALNPNEASGKAETDGTAEASPAENAPASTSE